MFHANVAMIKSNSPLSFPFLFFHIRWASNSYPILKAISWLERTTIR